MAAPISVLSPCSCSDYMTLLVVGVLMLPTCGSALMSCSSLPPPPPRCVLRFGMRPTAAAPDRSSVMYSWKNRSFLTTRHDKSKVWRRRGRRGDRHCDLGLQTGGETGGDPDGNAETTKSADASSDDAGTRDYHDERGVTFYSPNVELDNDRFLSDLRAGDNSGEPGATTTSSGSGSTNEYSFFDEATIYVRAGSGGQGSSTYKKGPAGQDGPPDGGDGGRGGDVVLEVDVGLNTLAGLTDAWRPNSFGGGGAASAQSRKRQRSFRPLSFRAENGRDGGRGYRNGRFGKDVCVRVPPGTIVQEEVDETAVDPATGKNVVVNTSFVDIGSVDAEHRLIVAKGGEGGEGSAAGVGKSRSRGVRRPRLPPVGGERKRLKLTLKVVADVAIVAVPNAGKSTLLAAVTRAQPKIANYPFTTVIPNLGVWVPESSGNEPAGGNSGLILCDVPGLIAGAAEGVGLGHEFLRHVERCHVILHLIDATSNDPVGDFNMVNREILRYGSGKLAQMPQVVVVNKIDAWEEGMGEDWEEGLATRVSRHELELSLKEVMPHSRLMWMSAKECNGLDELMTRLAAFVKKVKDTS